jgi:Zn-dependent M28 family amino/carboxypeptidase
LPKHLIASLVLFAGVLTAETPSLPELSKAAATITAENILRHVRELSRDDYAGRLPGTPGEEKSVNYIVTQTKAIGLQPAGSNGGWTQMVSLYGTRSKGTMTITVKNNQELPLRAGADYLVYSTLPDGQIDVHNSEIVFAGYGVVAPEYGWNDYAGMDVKGATVVIFSGDPPVTDPKDPSKLDETKFLGTALTVYGRAGTKLDTAFARGALAVITVNPAQQPGTAPPQNNARENMTLRDGNERKRVRAQANLNADKARTLFAATGNDFDALRVAAAKPGFRALKLGARVTISVTNTVRQFESANVLGKIDGSDPTLKNEYVIYSGHWDHHGQEGTEIFHGASDNAAGTAGVLELARAFKALRPAPKRTMVFFWPTAEEKGLLGARWYVEHPVYPLAVTAANINLDYFSNWGWGRTRDFSIIGIGNSTLDDLTSDAVKRQGRMLTGDTAPAEGFYFRSDHYEFARVGVPSLETSPGIEHIGKPEGFGVQKRTEYIRNDYHKASDVVKPDWDLSGAVEDLQILLEVGYRVAQQPDRPKWKKDAIWRPKP